MSLNPRARIYLSLVVLVAVGLQAYWLQAWKGPVSADFGLMLVMLVLSVVAMHFPLAISPRCKVDTSTAVYFASLLLFGAPLAVALVGVSQLIGGMTLSMRRHPIPGKRVRTLRSTLFNTGQLMIAVGLGGLMYYSVMAHVIPAPITQLANLWAVPMAAATIYLTNSLAVSVMIGLQLEQNPTEVWLTGWRLDALQFTGLFLIGLVTALASVQYTWVPLIMALPTGLIYLSLKRTVELMEQTVSAVEAMADVVDMRDHYTFEHSKRVAEYAAQIARRLGLSAEEIAAIRLSARVHDLGKMGVPDNVLLKQGKLTTEEWDVMRQHPQIGHQILSRFPQYQRGKELVLTHHERFDGTGYPRGLAGDRLPLGAQIIAVADALEAMTSDRPYRSALSLDQALAEFRRLKGSQWHPQVVEALESLVAQQGIRATSTTQFALSA